MKAEHYKIPDDHAKMKYTVLEEYTEHIEHINVNECQRHAFQLYTAPVHLS